MKATRAYVTAQKLTVVNALQLLKDGNRLCTPGANMDTLSYVPELTCLKYRWQGINDQGPSFLSEAEVSSLIVKYKFYII